MEAIKGAVQHGLGAAFVSTAAIAKELELRLLARVVRALDLAAPAALCSSACCDTLPAPCNFVYRWVGFFVIACIRPMSV